MSNVSGFASENMPASKGQLERVSNLVASRLVANIVPARKHTSKHPIHSCRNTIDCQSYLACVAEKKRKQSVALLAQEATDHLIQSIPAIDVTDSSEANKGVAEKIASRLVASILHVAKADKQHDVKRLAEEVASELRARVSISADVQDSKRAQLETYAQLVAQRTIDNIDQPRESAMWQTAPLSYIESCSCG